MPLFKITLTADCEFFPLRKLVQYLHCNEIEILREMFDRALTLKGSEYYGYTKAEIEPFKVEEFPEVRQTQVSITDKHEKQITHLEHEIIKFKKLIQKHKNKIRTLRGQSIKCKL